MTADNIKKILDKHQKWLKGDDGGERAILDYANLVGANLDGANLRRVSMRGTSLVGASLVGANLDFSYWPLWCGSLGVKIDKRLFCQLAYHLCRVAVDDDDCKAAQRALTTLANQFHRVEEYGTIEPIKDAPGEAAHRPRPVGETGRAQGQ